MGGPAAVAGTARGWAALALLCVPACGWGGDADVPPHLTFPPRADHIVAATPSAAPAGPAPPGQLDQDIATFNDRGGRTYDPADVPPARRDELTAALDELFGTPSEPRFACDDADRAAAGRLGLVPEQLAEGVRLYRRHCLQCHGPAGDGRGPTGQWIHPHPRDFRRGEFKFGTTGPAAAGKPAREDLLRTLRDGLPGTAMPSFGLLGADTLDRLAAAATFLSVRGEVETRLLLSLLAEGDEDADLRAAARGFLSTALRQWAAARPQPPATGVVTESDEDMLTSTAQDSIRRGWRLFTDAGGAGCIQCHEGYGRAAAWRYDAWGAAVRPADLTAGVLKGGKRAEDVAARVRCGVAPSGMPAVPALRDDQLADLVRFVRALPKPRLLPDDVRRAVGGPAAE